MGQLGEGREERTRGLCVRAYTGAINGDRGKNGGTGVGEWGVRKDEKEDRLRSKEVRGVREKLWGNGGRGRRN